MRFPYHSQRTSRCTDISGRVRSPNPKRYETRRCRGPGIPRLWNEIYPNGRYPGSHYLSEAIRGRENDPKAVEGQSSEKPGRLYPLPKYNIPFAPYVEKKTWQPTASANMMLDSRGINVSILQNWMMICTKLHDHRCDWKRAGGRPEATGPKLLIDVDNMNLVPAEPGFRYVALSYMWGEVPSSCTAIQSLSTPVVAHHQVIRDAMDLVRTLGEKFLWVDRFCIPQDDGPDKQSQLDAMGSIYAGAWLTIFAAQNADASQGLYGTRKVFDAAKDSVSPLTHKRKGESKPAGEKLTNKEVILRNARALMCTPWYSRGWTFQEHLFSQRCILFHDDSVGWECELTSWHEAQDLSDLLPPRSPRIVNEPVGLHKMVLSPWPDMFRYARLVSLYNRRALSYPEDIVDAFRGALSLLSRSYHGVLISGLPEMFFNSTLLWQPWYPMVRRKAKGRSKEDTVLPSWSWMGWCGDFCSDSWAIAYSYMRPTHARGISGGNISSWRIVSTVDWYYSEQFGGKRERIVDRSQAGRELINNPSELRQKGWTRHTDNRGNTFYRHRSDPTQEFWYPIPILAKPQVNSPLINARFIHGRTRNAVFNIGQQFSSRASKCDAVDLISREDGRWAGVLRLNLNLDHDRIRAHSKTCELVELSAGYFGAGINGEKIFDEWDSPERPRGKGRYEFYNVLCVKWREQHGSRIAYRRALGRVEKSKWNAVATEIDLTLG